MTPSQRRLVETAMENAMRTCQLSGGLPTPLEPGARLYAEALLAFQDLYRSHLQQLGGSSEWT